MFISGTMHIISYSVIHDGVFFCSLPEWTSSIGYCFILAPLFMRMLRVYRIFTYFGKLGKQWSDGVLFAEILIIIGISITYLTILQVIGGFKGMNIEMLVTPEGSFPYYEVVQACVRPIIAAALTECKNMVLITSPCYSDKKYSTTLQRHKESQCICLLGISHLLHLISTFTDPR